MLVRAPLQLTAGVKKCRVDSAGEESTWSCLRGDASSEVNELTARLAVTVAY